jgi:hypothetical protein
LELREGGDMEQHLFKLEELFDKLAAAGKELDEDFKVAIMLSSLPDSYDVLTTALEARSDDELTLGMVKQKLIDEWRKRGLSSISDSNKEDSKALKVMNRREVRCYYCDQVGHIKSRCYKWLELQRAEKDNEKEKEKEKEKDKAKWAKEFDEDESNFAFGAGNYEASDWCIDSGATMHMTSNRRFFETFENNEKCIRIADGKSVRSTGVGNGKIFVLSADGRKVELQINNVLYVPGLSGSLLSVAVLVKLGYQVNFGGTSCKILCGDKAVVIADVNKVGLYQLKSANVVENTKKIQNKKMNSRCDEMAFMGRLRRDNTSYRSYIGTGNKMSIVNGSGSQDVGKYGTKDGWRIGDRNRVDWKWDLKNKREPTTVSRKTLQ